MYGFQYDRAGTDCAAGPAPGAIALRDGVLEVEPRLVDLGIYNCRPPRGVDPGPRVRVSLHGEGRAWDAGTAAGRELGDWLAEQLVDLAAVLGVQEVIWWRRRWVSSTRRWGTYEGPGLDPHTTHVHVGLCWAAASTLRASRVVSALRHEVDDEEDEMDQILWFSRPGALGQGPPHAYRVRGLTAKHLPDRKALGLVRFTGALEPARSLPGGEDNPLGEPWQDTVVIVDGPCKNIT